MSAIDELTLAKVRRGPTISGSRFLALYERLIRRDELTRDESTLLLSRSILFLRANDRALNSFGYSIVLHYGANTGDWEPLRSIAAVHDFAPVAQAIGLTQAQNVRRENYAEAFLAAYRENFRVETPGGTTYRTLGQMELRRHARAARRAVIVAPTSYGKSEMIAERVASSLERNVCVIVPTKALISQVRRSLIRHPTINEARQRIVVHPDEYKAETGLVAVLTQERLFRLLQLHRQLALDVLLVDEAHNLLKSDARSEHLAQTIIVAAHRNPDIELAFFTPFVAASEDLQLVQVPSDIAGFAADEHVKVERVFFTDLNAGRLWRFDQFLRRAIEMHESIPRDELAAVQRLAGEKNINYVNRPRDAEELAYRLASTLERVASSSLEAAAAAIGDLIHPNYRMVECVRRGVIFHHGQVPESVRQYVEDLFAKRGPETARYIVATSTLLEGVNMPADRLFIHSPRRGRGNLSPSAFRNLIGRVGRFNDIFDPNYGSLEGLLPKIYVLDGAYAGRRFNPLGFLSTVADANRDPSDDVENQLLVRAEELDHREELLIALENAEPGSSGLETPRRVATEVGELCFRNHIGDFSVFDSERLIQSRVDESRGRGFVLDDPRGVVELIHEVFLSDVTMENAQDLARLQREPRARDFYTKFVGWRSRALPYRAMIREFLEFWKSRPEVKVFVGAKWGDESFDGDSGAKSYVSIRRKSEIELVNLAVVKIKEEQDFVDHRLMPYVEVLNQLSLLARGAYEQIKYGTNDRMIIALLHHGFSLDLARLVRDSYEQYVDLRDDESVAVDTGLIRALEVAGENEVLVYEASCLV